MKKEKTVLAALHKPIRFDLTGSIDVIKLRINRIANTKFTTGKKPLQLLKELPALKISNTGFYANARVHLKVNSTFEFASMEEILEKQSGFMKTLIDDNKEMIKERASQAWNERYQNRETQNSNQTDTANGFQHMGAYISSNKVIIWLLLIPFVLLMLFFILFYLNS